MEETPPQACTSTENSLFCGNNSVFIISREFCRNSLKLPWKIGSKRHSLAGIGRNSLLISLILARFGQKNRHGGSASTNKSPADITGQSARHVFNSPDWGAVPRGQGRRRSWGIQRYRELVAPLSMILGGDRRNAGRCEPAACNGPWRPHSSRAVAFRNEASDALDEVGRVEQRRVALVGHFDDLRVGVAPTHGLECVAR